MSSAQQATIFETPRLRLRALNEEDETLYCDLYCDAATMRFIGPPLTREVAAQSFRKILELQHRQSPDRLFMAMIEKSSGQAIGICATQRIHEDRRRADVGIIVKAQWRERGFATEAATAQITHAFATLAVDEVCGEISSDHAVVERLAIGVGLSRQGGETGNERCGWRAWSVDRQSWGRR